MSESVTVSEINNEAQRARPAQAGRVRGEALAGNVAAAAYLSLCRQYAQKVIRQGRRAGCHRRGRRRGQMWMPVQFGGQTLHTPEVGYDLVWSPSRDQPAPSP